MNTQADNDDDDDEDEDDDDDDQYEHSQSERKLKSIHAGVAAGTPRRRSSSTFFDTAAASQVRFKSHSFQDLNLSRPLIKACDVLGFVAPTPIQSACIPLALSGRDICGSATTGSGKTAAFALPMIDRLLYRSRRVAVTRCLILSPTRELAVQMHSMIEKLAQFTDVRVAAIVGGLSLKAQETMLRSQPDIVVATPGRLIDHARNTRSVGLEDLQVGRRAERKAKNDASMTTIVINARTPCRRSSSWMRPTACSSSGFPRNWRRSSKCAPRTGRRCSSPPR